MWRVCDSTNTLPYRVWFLISALRRRVWVGERVVEGGWQGGRRVGRREGNGLWDLHLSPKYIPSVSVASSFSSPVR